MDQKGDFWFHGPWKEGDRPLSGGCVCTQYEADEREVMHILRQDLGFGNGQTVRFAFASKEGSIAAKSLGE